jgi:hypothetical protein
MKADGQRVVSFVLDDGPLAREQEELELRLRGLKQGSARDSTAVTKLRAANTYLFWLAASLLSLVFIVAEHGTTARPALCLVIVGTLAVAFAWNKQVAVAIAEYADARAAQERFLQIGFASGSRRIERAFNALHQQLVRDDVLPTQVPLRIGLYVVQRAADGTAKTVPLHVYDTHPLATRSSGALAHLLVPGRWMSLEWDDLRPLVIDLQLDQEVLLLGPAWGVREPALRLGVEQLVLAPIVAHGRLLAIVAAELSGGLRADDTARREVGEGLAAVASELTPVAIELEEFAGGAIGLPLSLSGGSAA